MGRSEVEGALAGLEVIIRNYEEALATQKASLETITEQEKRSQRTLERYRSGDDLREVLIESGEQNLLRIEEVIEQQRSTIDQLEIQLRQSRKHVEFLKKSLEG